jgi:hypothetical protein
MQITGEKRFTQADWAPGIRAKFLLSSPSGSLEGKKRVKGRRKRETIRLANDNDKGAEKKKEPPER